MLNQITIWEWLEMLKEEGVIELSRVINKENYVGDEIISLCGMTTVYINDFGILADEMEIRLNTYFEGESIEYTKICIRLLSCGNMVMTTSLMDSEKVTVRKYGSYCVELVRGVNYDHEK